MTHAQSRLTRGSPIPLYLQIARRLRAELPDAPSGDRPLYTEQELARRFDVHRLTVRQALRELERDGLVHRQRGLGTFRSPHKVRGEPLYLDSFIDHWSMQGRRVRAEVLEIVDDVAEGRAASALRVVDGADVVHIRRRRFVDEDPLVLDHIYLPSAIGHALQPDDFVSRTLHRAIRLRTGRVAVEASLEIEATTVREDEADLLCAPVGNPLFRRHIVLLDELRTPLSYGWSLYRADLYTYTLSVPLPEESAYASPEESVR
jgi:GntR family transcriptional regulator